MSRVLAVRGVRKGFGRREVLTDVSLTVEAGQTVGLVGLNGSGKSTFLRIAAGILQPDSGTGHVCGVPLGSRRVPRCGLMLEHPPFIDEFSGFDNLTALGRVGGAVVRADVDAALRSVGLDPKDRRHVRHYSQGMRQRLGLAQALMGSPQLLLLDEPLNGLDPTGIIDVRGVLRRAAAQGTAVLFSSHVLSEVQLVCDRVAVMHGGMLTELDPEDRADAGALERAYRRKTGYRHG